jgi:aldehyde reductase
MAYSPIEQATLLRNPGLVRFSGQHGITPAQAALGWLLAQDNVIAIPKTSHRERLRENHGALALRLSPQQLAGLDVAFPPPRGPHPLEML